MKKSTVLLGIIAAILFQTSFFAQENPSTEELLKRIEALEAEKNKTKDWDVSLYGRVRTE